MLAPCQIPALINNVRKTIIREQLTDPQFYEQMSKLLDDLIKQNRAAAAEYEAFLRKAEALVKRLVGKQATRAYPRRCTASGRRR